MRQGCHYGRPAWTKLHRRWLAGLKFEQAVHHLVLEDYIAAVEVSAAVEFKTELLHKSIGQRSASPSESFLRLIDDTATKAEANRAELAGRVRA